MGNAESSSSGGGRHGEMEEDKREQQQDTESGFEKALKVAAAAAAAYGTYKLMSHSEAEEGKRSITAGPAMAVWSSSESSSSEEEEEEEEEEERMAGTWMRERAGRSSSIPDDDASAGKSIVHFQGAATVAVWSRPPNGWVKLNTDFSGPSDLSGPSGMGIIIRGHRAELLWCSAEQVEDCVIITDDEGKPLALQVADGNGEALALLKGLQIARDQGYTKVVAETDHKTNADSILNVQYRASHLIKLIRQYKCSWFEECEIKHIGRKGNQCADHLAGVVAKQRSSIPFASLPYSPDQKLQNLLQEDKKKSFGILQC